jgi:hypothetical protein
MSFDFKGSINISDLKTQIEEKKKASGNKDLFWKPQPGSNTIRIIPYKHGNSPFNELYFHYLPKESLLCPKMSLGKSECPICDFVKQLYTSGSEDDKLKAKDLRAKPRYYIPIIVRDDIAKGGPVKPRFWGAASTVYESIKNYVLMPDYGDIADPEAGHDITLQYTERNAQNIWGKTELMMRPSKTKMLDNMEDALRVYNEVPNIMEIFKEYSSEEILEKLKNFVEDPTDQISGNPNAVSSEVNSQADILNSKLAGILNN